MSLDPEYRNRVLRAYIEGRNWDNSAEFALVRQVVLQSAQLLPSFPMLVDYEWDVRPGSTAGGRGDLVFGDDKGGFAIVEVKAVEGASGSRTRRRNKVESQALRYAAAWALRHPTASVVAYVFTDDHLFGGLRLADQRVVPVCSGESPD